MSSKIERAREAVIEFFKTANPQDEFFMITFADKPEEISDFTQSVDDIQGKLVYTVPKGRTALLDAIYLGVSKMRQAKYPKKALLIISDGGDNHSRYTEGEIKSLVKEADVLIYAIGIYDHYFHTEEERLGPALLSDVAELTGGRAFTIDNPNDLADVATKIGIELRNQYVLGYRPKNPAHDGKWRKIKVKLFRQKDCRRCVYMPNGLLCSYGIVGPQQTMPLIVVAWIVRQRRLRLRLRLRQRQLPNNATVRTTQAPPRSCSACSRLNPRQRTCCARLRARSACVIRASGTGQEPGTDAGTSFSRQKCRK